MLFTSVFDGCYHGLEFIPPFFWEGVLFQSPNIERLAWHEEMAGMLLRTAGTLSRLAER
jgi:hypothetical protein